MELYSTKYPNNSRIVTGTPILYQDDVILLCDTALNPVTINLLEIANGYWSTQWKLYVADNSANASVNNITINAGPGQTINGQSNVVLNINGMSMFIRIVRDNEFIAYSSTGNPSGHIIEDEGTALPQRPILNFIGLGVTAYDLGGKTIVDIPGVSVISLTNVALLTLISTNTIIPGQLYQVTDAIFITTYFATQETVPVIVQGVTNNSVSLEGQGIFLNADYQKIGDYSGVPGFTINTGVWVPLIPYVVGDVVMWNNMHWINTTGANTNQNPLLDGVNWTVIIKSLSTGYIQEIDFVTYDVENNIIRSRKDKRNNYVENNFAERVLRKQTFNVFQWGNNKVAYNQVIQNSIFECYNYNNIGGTLVNITENGFYANVCSGKSSIAMTVQSGVFGSFKFNTFTNFSTVSIDEYFEGEISYCVVENSRIQIATRDTTDQISKSYFFNSEAVVYLRNTLAGYLSNIMRNTVLNLSDIRGLFAENEFTNCVANILICDINSVITNNSATNSIIKGTVLASVTNINSQFTHNVINDSEVRIDNSAGADLGFISHNVITQKSILSVEQNNLKIWYNTISNESQLLIGTNDAIIGKTIKNPGNRILNQSIFSADWAKATTLIDNCIFDLRTQIIISNECNGDFSNCEFKGVNIQTDNMNGSFSNLNCDIGDIVVPTITLGFANGAIVRGNYNSIQVELDLTDPTIYDLPTKTLFIPNEVLNFAGVYVLKNATGQIIEFIDKLNYQWYNEFTCLTSTITFLTNPISPIINYYIVAQSAGPYTIVGRSLPNFADSVIIKTNPASFTNAIIETRIFV